jgi:hypothetical protein
MGKLGIVKKVATQFSVDDLKKQFPAKKNSINEDTVKLLNDANDDAEFNGDEFMKTLVEYQNVMIDCSGSMGEYINAVKFCAYLESESANITEAYCKARSNDDFVSSRVGAVPGSADYNALTAAASRYRKSPMVRQILTQSDMPLYLMFQGSRYQAVALLAREMQNAAYSKDRISAADKLLTHVKPPDNLQVELAVGPSQQAQDLSMQLSEQLAASVAMQRKMLEAGKDFSESTKMGINLNDAVDAEVIDG